MRNAIKFTVSICAIAVFLGAAPAQGVDSAGKNQPKSLAFIPGQAVKAATNVYSLGKSKDPQRGDMVEGYLIVHPKKGLGKPMDILSKAKGGAVCYGFLGKDAKWKTIEPWVVNPANPYGMPDDFILGKLNASIARWESASAANILGSGATTTAVLIADESSMDGLNEVYFGPLGEGTIAVTIVWGIFGGPPQTRELREWDQVYNTFYNWGDATIDPSVMDFQNIATHELGHSMGMADLYQPECSEQTMYGYGTEGETKKRDLNTGDIAGISKLY